MAKFTQDEPVLAVTGAFIVVNYVLAFLVEHGIITNTQAGSTPQVIVPLVAAGITFIAGLIIRRLVTPAKKVETWLEQHFGPELSAAVDVVRAVDPNALADARALAEGAVDSVAESVADKASDLGISVEVPENSDSDSAVTIPE